MEVPGILPCISIDLKVTDTIHDAIYLNRDRINDRGEMWKQDREKDKLEMELSFPSMEMNRNYKDSSASLYVLTTIISKRLLNIT